VHCQFFSNPEVLVSGLLPGLACLGRHILYEALVKEQRILNHGVEFVVSTQLKLKEAYSAFELRA
jgi:hypothetical protein